MTLKAFITFFRRCIWRYSLNYVSTRDDIMMMCVEYDVDKYYTEIESILAKMMPIGSIGTVDYPFSDDTDIA